MRRFRNTDNQNNLIGIFLLVLLAVIAGPSTLPRLLPLAEAGVPCDRLPLGLDRAQHQSLIGRMAENPLSVVVNPDPVPAQGEPLVITVTIINNTIGSVPILYNPNQVLVTDNGSSGLGIIFQPSVNTTNGAVRQNQGLTSFDEANIRVLGPRQRCYHRFELPVDPSTTSNIYTGTVGVKAYYRINTPGPITTAADGSPSLYPDQGLHVSNNYIESDLIPIPLPSQ